MKHEFLANWHRYRVRSHSATIQPKIERDPCESGLAPEEKPSSEGGFRELVLEAVDEGLSSLGKASKEAVYFYLEKAFKIQEQDIPSKIEGFTAAIEEIFGPGAKILEIQMMRHLFRKIGYNLEYYPENRNLRFTEYVGAARASYRARAGQAAVTCAGDDGYSALPRASRATDEEEADQRLDQVGQTILPVSSAAES